VVKPILLSISATMLLALVGLGATAAEPVFTDAQWAATSAATSKATPTGELVGSSLLSIALSLAVVVALAVVLGWLVKRLGVKRLVQPKGRHLEVLDAIGVAYKRQVTLVRIGNQAVLIGLGEHEMTHLATLPLSVIDLPAAAVSPLPGAVAVTGGVPTSEMPAPPDPAFRTLLTKVLKG
jgi:flagellar biosynthetic protein FliO